LKLHGTYRDDRRYDDEPAPVVKVPQMPNFLKGMARKEWQRVAPLLAAKKCLTEWDRSMLAAYCFEWGVYESLCKKLKGPGDYVAITTNGNEIMSPMLAARNKALKNFKELAAEFGLSPASRTRIKTSDSEESNPFQELLKGKHAG